MKSARGDLEVGSPCPWAILLNFWLALFGDCFGRRAKSPATAARRFLEGDSLTAFAPGRSIVFSTGRRGKLGNIKTEWTKREPLVSPLGLVFRCSWAAANCPRFAAASCCSSSAPATAPAGAVRCPHRMMIPSSNPQALHEERDRDHPIPGYCSAKTTAEHQAMGAAKAC